MQREHGGYTSSEIDESLPESTTPSADGERTGSRSDADGTAVKPKRLSARARELNDKFNEALNLILKHFLEGLSEQELTRLAEIRGEVSSAVIGVEFDFEERIFKVKGRMWLGIAVALLWILPQIPSMKELLAKAKESKNEVPNPS